MASFDASSIRTEIESVILYTCENDPIRHVVQCSYNYNTKEAEWGGIENVVCIPAAKGCLPKDDFSNMTDFKTLYSVGETVKYRCPNGILRTATCKMITETVEDQNIIKYVWNPLDDCKGIFLALFRILSRVEWIRTRKNARPS